MLVDLDTAKGCDQAYGFDRFEKEREEGLSLHDKLFSDVHHTSGFSKQAVHDLQRSAMQHKANSIFSSQFGEVRESQGGGSVKGEIKVEWGGSQGTTYSGSVAVQGQDKNGNSGQIKVEQSSDKQGSVTASGGHDTKSGGNGSKK